MNRPARPDGLNINTRDVEPPSQGSLHRTSLSPSFSMMTLPSVNPEPAYIAPAAAATIAVAELGDQFGVQIYDERGNTADVATVLPNSLSLVNAFLDRLLFNFLSCAKSTSLASLRPAIVEVLKPRLAKEAIAGADEELQEYLDGDDEELNAFHNGQDPPMDWDLELVWRRARLRCMVYTRLGDMEEEDEEMYISQEQMDDEDTTKRISREYGIVSPAVAIFLTSILEFIGEHALIVATHAAVKRTENRLSREVAAGGVQPAGFPRITVEEGDVEKIALNANLGRLWRSWRKGVRSPRDSISGRPFRSLSIGSISRKSSVAGVSDMQGTIPSVNEVLEPDPTAIPLPMSEHDIDEIEVPGYSAARSLLSQTRARPASLLLVSDYVPFNRQTGFRESELETIEDTPRESEATEVPPPMRGRSQSLPISRPEFDVISDAESWKSTKEDPSDEAEETQASEAAVDQTPILLKKPRSAPTTPSYHSMLNFLSQHVARPLQRSPPPESDGATDGHDGQDEVDPAADALPFNGNDYIINEQERAEMDSSAHPTMAGPDPSEAAFVAMNEKSQPMEPEFRDAHPPYPSAEHAGDVSPMEHMPTQSGEVSPIEPSDDEDDNRRGLSRKASRDIYNEPVSPLLEHHPEPVPTIPVPVPVAATVPAPVSVPAPKPVPEPIPVPVEVSPPVPPKVPKKEGPRSETFEQVQPIPPAQTRQRRNENRTGDEKTRDGKREAFVVGEIAQIPAAIQASSAPIPVPPKDQVAESSQSRRVRNIPTQAIPTPPTAAVPDVTSAPIEEQQEQEPTHISRRKVPQGVAVVAQTNTRSAARQRPAPPATPTSQPGVEKAAVQRVTGSPSSNRDSLVSASRNAESDRRNSRGQTKPQKAKARITSAGENIRESVASKISNEGRHSNEDRYSRGSQGKTGTPSDFDTLIASDETIQYTLTPQNMRNIEERKSYVSSPTTPQDKTMPPLRGDSAAHSAPGVAAAAPAPAPVNRAAQAMAAIATAPSTRVAPGSNVPVPRRGLSAVPREARVSTAANTTKDFADFIRSTGPDNSTQTSGDRLPVVSTRSSLIAKEQGRIRTTKAGNRLQAREPRVRASENKDLLDFLREGPPSDRNANAQRGIFDQNSVASTQDSFVTSTNSRTGLLESNRNVPKMNSAIGRRQPPIEEGMPQRKQRRVRDPYAIDTDSDDEGDDSAATPKAQAEEREESLADFLRSAPPPSSGNAPPPLNLSKKTIQAVQRRSSNAGAQIANRVHLPTPGAIGSKIAAATAAATTAATNRVGSIGGGGGGGGVNEDVSPAPRFSRPRQQFQARDERGGDGSTRDLADFFKHAEPPPSAGPPDAYASTGGKEEGGLLKMFNRRR